MTKVLIGIVLLLLSVYQFYRTFKMFQYEKNNGNENTSPFLMMALFSNIVFSVTLFGIGIAIVFNLI